MGGLFFKRGLALVVNRVFENGHLELTRGFNKFINTLDSSEE
jgi:hypothetical protein